VKPSSAKHSAVISPTLSTPAALVVKLLISTMRLQPAQCFVQPRGQIRLKALREIVCHGRMRARRARYSTAILRFLPFWGAAHRHKAR